MDRWINKYTVLFIACFGIAIGGIFVLNFSYVTSTEKSDILTTNLDLVNKQINDIEPEVNKDEAAPVANIFELGQKWLAQNFNVWRLYQNLANPTSRYVVLNSGLRKEEIAALLSNELNWNIGKKLAFISADKYIDNKNKEGYYSPGGYLFPRNTTPDQAYKVMMERFNDDVESKYATTTANIINVDTAVRVASIIEREAAGTNDMKLISGVIWNRIFKDMSLDMDATLQYAKGNNKNGWWPPVLSEDKYINSPYNTYQNKGLPPTPISNVSIAALKAALNPRKTNCLFYLHDRHGNIHCSVTYQEHKANIKKYYR
ncbi:MAG: endolytic transglycosylase MltG [Candidatus Vogelbacteria bacterium]|nr:endolytic transglycosylase MltG [Candidatus Vogelbacteria bacterium]